jgi:hypothetical protein
MAFDFAEDFTLAQLKLVEFYQAVIHHRPDEAECLIREVSGHINNIIAAIQP